MPMIILKSVGTVLDTDRLRLYPINADGSFSSGGESIHIYDADEEWFAALSDSDSATVKEFN